MCETVRALEACFTDIIEIGKQLTGFPAIDVDCRVTCILKQ